MMRLNKHSISTFKSQEALPVPGAAIFELPEKVLQFGTGVLLRGLPDYYIDKANKLGVFNGRVLVVKSTGGSVDDFAQQDALYTHCIKGIEDGHLKEENIINASISRVLSSSLHWEKILESAGNAEMQIIISNTTEVGIVLVETDKIDAAPPVSFPGKLLAFLYRRYRVFAGSAESGMVIIPTELIVDNGTKLKKVLVQLARLNQLDETFIEWLQTANDFCNSLVDRIVPGALPADKQLQFEEKAGYEDGLVIMSEVYSLWAIETNSERTKAILSFSEADKGVVITTDINRFRELKLRLLNGTHTFSCGLAYLSGFDLVNEAMQHESMRSYIHELMMEEIVPCITGHSISIDEAELFANSVISRFSNPNISHKWLSITVQYTGKMKMRNVPLLLKYYHLTGDVPKYMAMGFAAYLMFMKATEEMDGKYYGRKNGERYLIQDESAGIYYELWKNNTPEKVVEKVLADKTLWGEDLTTIHHFEETVKNFLLPYVEVKG